MGGHPLGQQAEVDTGTSPTSELHALVHPRAPHAQRLPDDLPRCRVRRDGARVY